VEYAVDHEIKLNPTKTLWPGASHDCFSTHTASLT
jgi:hypothetical protein